MTDLSPEALDADQAVCDAATPGPWHHGSRWAVAATHPPIAPDRNTCAYCHLNAPSQVWPQTKAEGKGKWHAHLRSDPFDYDGHQHRLEDAEGGTIAGNYDYEVGGIIEPADARFIAAARTRWPAAIARVRELEAENRRLNEQLAEAREDVLDLALAASASHGHPIGLAALAAKYGLGEANPDA